MIVYLAGSISVKSRYILEQNGEADEIKDKSIDIAILESFYYCHSDKLVKAIIPKLKNFMLDSGAFTFFTLGRKVEWIKYIDRYIDFINENKVELFFELDIDILIGYEKVLKLRRYLEKGVGRKCIPVWHKNRGKDEFLRLCDEYDYVSIGGIASNEIKTEDYKLFPWFINEAHKRNTKIHALGFTNLNGLRKYHFDSVDSSTWTYGNRFGYLYKFNGRTLVKHNRPRGMRIADSQAVSIHNFNEWIKFQRYAKKHL